VCGLINPKTVPRRLGSLKAVTGRRKEKGDKIVLNYGENTKYEGVAHACEQEEDDFAGWPSPLRRRGTGRFSL